MPVSSHGNNAAGVAYAFRDLVRRTAAYAAAAGSVHELDSKANGCGNLQNDLGKIGAVSNGRHAGHIVIAEIRRENTDISFAAEHNDLFIVYGNTAEILSRRIRNGRFEADSEIETDIDCVIAAVERHIAYGYVRPDNVCAFAAEIGGMVDSRLTVLIDKYSQILDAVLISC